MERNVSSSSSTARTASDGTPIGPWSFGSAGKELSKTASGLSGVVVMI
jgi:hypothetical protein